MTIFYYSIYDDKADEYGPMFPAKNDKVAVRHFKQLIAGSNNQDDYTLYCICGVDQESGQLGLPFNKYEVIIDNSEVNE